MSRHVPLRTLAIRLGRSLAAPALVALVAFVATAPRAAVFVVDETSDEVDALPGDGLCLALPTTGCTLRAAIQETNALPGDDTVLVNPGSYFLRLSGSDEDASATGDLDITDGLTLTGAAAGGVTVDASLLATRDRVIHAVSTTATISITDMTIRGGQVSDATSPNPSGRGAGIHVGGGTVTLQRLVVRDNEAQDRSAGAGVYVGGGTFLMEDSVVRDNIGTNINDGAGMFIFDAVQATIRRTTIAFNVNESQGGGAGVLCRLGPTLFEDVTISDNIGNRTGIGTGGGMEIGTATQLGNVTIRRSTIARNRADTGAGIAVRRGSLDIRNSTISDNVARGEAAGLTVDAGQVATLNNVTIDGNVAQGDIGAPGNGGGIWADPAATVNVSNTIVARNVSLTGAAGPDLFGNITSLGHNFIGVDDGTGGAAGPNDLRGMPGPVDPRIQVALTDNGGLTLTKGPLVPSPVLDRGSVGGGPPACETEDQRAYPRPLDGDGDGVPECDIGAVEGCVGPGDADGDGHGDPCDNCPDDVNVDQADTDGDLLGDACDDCEFPDMTDGDGDGVVDACDNCASLPNVNVVPTDCNGDTDTTDVGEGAGEQCDADEDGAGDACDPCPLDPLDDDLDGDGVCDDGGDAPCVPPNTVRCDDNCLGVANSSQADTDGDGFGDECDTCPLDPDNRDSDSDTICDDGGDDPCTETVRVGCDDNCVDDFNPTQQDADLDGLGDACDPCPLDATNIDGDGDTICNDGGGPGGDPCPDFVTIACDDNCIDVANELQGDSDDDGFGDACDNCPADFNPMQEDGDMDLVGNTCDPCPASANNRDSDRDSVCDDGGPDPCAPGESVGCDDNCRLVDNAGQEDADGDGLGNACDPCRSSTDNTDTDGDTVCDDGGPGPCTTGMAVGCDDNCIDDDNPLQEDADFDGAGDVCDICPLAVDPMNADRDADGVGDVCDNCPGDVNPQQGNTDGDTLGDACDSLCDLEPSAVDIDPAVEPLRVVKLPANQLEVTWETLVAPGNVDPVPYDLYRGTLPTTQTMGARAMPYDHTQFGQCVLPVAEATLTSPASSWYYLVAARCGTLNGSLGRDSFTAPRPAASTPCP